jgi:hypothetical protein
MVTGVIGPCHVMDGEKALVARVRCRVCGPWGRWRGADGGVAERCGWRCAAVVERRGSARDLGAFDLVAFFAEDREGALVA